MANPLSFPSLVQFVARLADRVTALERRRAAPVPDSLDDFRDTQILYGHSVSAPADGHVFTWDSSVSTPFGGAWVAAPSVAAVTEALASYSDDGLFDEVSDYSWETPGFVVAANSYQLVLVTVEVALSDISLGLIGTGFPGDAAVLVPTPWKLQAYATDAPTVPSLGNGTGSCGCTVPLWLHNDTDDEAPMSVTLIAQGTVGGPEFDATIDARAESVFQMAALTP